MAAMDLLINALAADEPERFGRLLDFCANTAICFGTAQIAAGVHLPMVFDPSASPMIIPPSFFREFEAPRLKRVFAAFQKQGALANWLHIAGLAGPVLPFYPGLNVHLANFDYCVSPRAACRALARTCLNGNIKSVSFLEAPTAKIRKKARELLNFFAGRGGFILSSGCEIPPESRPENITAMVTAAE